MSEGTDLEKDITKFMLALRRDKITGSFQVACKTAEILKKVVNEVKWHNAKHLIEQIIKFGKRIAEVRPLELAILNTVRRILFIIREAYKESELQNIETKNALPRAPSDENITSYPDSLRRSSTRISESTSTTSLFKVLEEDPDQDDFSKSYSNLKESIILSIEDFILELQNAYVSIADQARQHVHANEIIMTFGKSKAVEEFLKKAAKKRKFEVIVVESGPLYSGQETANVLSASNIETTLITDSAIFAIMARVNKVIVGTHAVMANGGLIAPTGTYLLAQAAKYHSVPFVVCTGLYKLSPLYAHDQDTFNELRSPSEILPFEETKGLGAEIKNPSWDYVPPQLVSLFITNKGGCNPSYIYRLVADYYHPEDKDL